MELSVLDKFYQDVVRRYDASTPLSVFAENEIKQVIAAMYDRRYPDLDARKHIPLDTNVSPGAMAWAYDSYEGAGQARWIGANPKDIPRVDVGKKRVTFPIEAFAVAYGWTVQELQTAQFANVPLSTKKAETQRRAAAEFEHTKLLFGEVTLNIPGFLTNSAVPLVGVPNGGWLTTATPDDMVEDLNFIIDRPWLGSSLVHQANTVLLPAAHMRRVQTSRLPNTNTTVLDFVKGTNPQVTEWAVLRELATAGTSSGPRAVAYQKAPDMLSGIIPQPFSNLPPQVEGFEVVVNGWQTIGGCVFFYPRSASYAEGM